MLKENQKCYCLYVNVTNNYISFKIEQGKFLGKVKGFTLGDYYAIEHLDDEVNYLKMEDIFKTEKAAIKHLVKILKEKASM